MSSTAISGPDSPAQQQPGGIPILVADDDPELGMILDTELSECGYRVSVVHDGAAALDRLREGSFRLAILDIRMPKVDGFQVLKFIRESKPGMKVIMLTAYADLRHLVMSREGGADEFLTKPYEFEMLRMTIESLLKS